MSSVVYEMMRTNVEYKKKDSAVDYELSYAKIVRQYCMHRSLEIIEEENDIYIYEMLRLQGNITCDEILKENKSKENAVRRL